MTTAGINAASRLHQRWPGLRRPHLRLLSAATPVRALPEIGAGVWLKDDSESAELYGGNKVRKLEWSLAEVVEQRRTVVITAGGLGTNHGLATALYAKPLGIRTVLVLVDQPVTAEVEANLAAMRATGAQVVLIRTKARAIAAVPLLMLRNIGARAPWILPVGGSNAAGVLGFAEAALELSEQVSAGELPMPAEIVVPVGSGGSAAGLLLGLRLAGLPTKVRGVLVNDKTRITAGTITRMANSSLRLLGRSGADVPRTTFDGFELDVSQLGDGYGHATAAGEQATKQFATAGITLDPVYTAKAAASLLASRGEGPTVFWHTFNARPLPGPQ